MADRPEDRGEGYDWLYRRPGRTEDDDATRRIPVSQRPDPRDGAAGADDDRTRVVPSHEGAEPTARQRAATRPPPPAARPPAPPREGGGPRRRRRRLWVAAVVLLVVLAFLVGVPLWAWTKITKVPAEPSGDRPPNTPGTTYLLVGSDSREGLTDEQKAELSTGEASGGRTDTIMVLHVPRFGGPTLLLSLPRDSIVDIPGVGSDKINAAYASGGPKLLVHTVESETGLRVDNYVEIGLGGFAGIVDAVGGVEICPKEAMNDPLAGLDIEAGCQEADGKTALGYARSRKLDSTGDIARVERQREVVGAIAANAASPWTFLNPVRYVSLSSAGADALIIGDNVGPIDLARFAWGMRRVTGGGGLTCTVPLADLAVHWDEEAADRLFEQIGQDDTDQVECSPTGGIG
jgi:LCP family protein required for cell wall assembly